jgi:hypothetical protein
MPASEAEALEVAQRDAVAARRVALVAAGRTADDGSSTSGKQSRRATIGGAGATPSIKKAQKRRRSL